MNERDCKILKIIAEEKNITTAAERLYITQPALTYRLKTIEKDLNTNIFIRTTRGLIFTPQGEEVLKYADDFLKNFEKTKRKITLMNDSVSGILKIAVSPAFAKYKLAKILSSFQEEYPDVEFSIKACISSNAMIILEEDDVHIAIVRGEHKWLEEKTLLTEEPIALVTNSEVSMLDLPILPYIIYETDYTFMKEISDWWREFYSVPPRETMHINDSDTCRQMISLGLGFSILPSIGLSEKKYLDLLITPLKHKNGYPLKRNTWLLHRSITMDIPLVTAFIDHVKTFKFI